MKLVLFDIDGTLLWTDGAGRRSMEGALQEVFGMTGDPDYRYDGKTDRQIVREQMRFRGVSDDEIAPRFDDVIDRYVLRLEQELARNPSAARICEGVPMLLQALGATEGITLGLLTGNVKRGARRKLATVGIDFAQFRVNAFGCDAESRPELPAVAQRRMHDVTGNPISGDRIVIIGDTPADIHCGRSLGVRAIGVATGRYSVAELEAHDPAAVFETLMDTSAVITTILES